MKNVVLGCLLLATSVFTLAGDVLSLKDGHPQTHVVKKGDTLWDISGIFLNTPWKWPELWHVNPQVDNPHLIYPGDVLNLVYINGQPRLVVKRGNDIKLSPYVRVSELDLAIPAIPLDAIAPFLNNSRVVDSEQLKKAPYVLAGSAGHIVSGAGDQLFTRGTFEEGQKSFGIFRPGQAFIDPETGESLGFQALAIAQGNLIALTDDVGTVALNQTTQEVRRSDRLLAEEEREINSSFFPDAPEDDINGYIIAVEGGVSQIGSMDVVVINKGSRDGMKVGHVMAIDRVGEKVRDPVTNEIVKVPDTQSGLLMVFRPFEKVSYALVLKASQTLKVLDKIHNP